MHKAAPVCAFTSCSVTNASTNGLTTDTNGGLVTWQASDPDAATHAVRTTVSGSRNRRMIAEMSLCKKGDNMSPCASDKVEIKWMHCLRTGDLSEELVVVIDERNEGMDSFGRCLAIVSSSVAAAECVSRSESLWRQVRTWCLKLWDGEWWVEVGLGGGIVVV
ncbi:hypothetical protein HanIR_Chr05g0245341 [Helianthus annuus]|nr:hypothetical protein HanIR_Chr05g0245341 [Helianthus annuus]